ncbi:DNA-binding protein WhiA [Actinotignum sanguinis]|uniref:DNA-binding protein WhiA n=1 Tax=Actinotignum sanguinis TaxID=1445614 RepID=UPI002A81ABA9|nr:DNA-binding protein WhiA [Actinotignum sanguinis]MDY5135851.1 DNA-binding protein WhiA [Actinotignum sanguinis]
MSALTRTVKDELATVTPASLSAALAELTAMFRYGGGLAVRSRTLELVAEVGHRPTAQRLWELVRQLFSVEPELLSVSSQMRQGQRFLVRSSENTERIAVKLGLLDAHGRPVRGLPPAVVGGSKADAGAAWRGAFLARGTLMEPGRNASLEIICPRLEAAYALGGLARRLDIPYRVRESRGAHRIDIHGGEAISDMLTRMGANDAVLRWEELRVEREVHGTVNRLANFDDANMRRSADAAVIAVIRVKRAFEILGTDVPENLRAAGEARIAHPEDSLNLLGEQLTPRATKDAVAGRLRRLNSMADKRAKELGIPDTMAAVRAAGHGAMS